MSSLNSLQLKDCSYFHMNQLQFITILALTNLIGCTGGTTSDLSVNNGQYIETPTDLLDLLPDGGIEAVDIEEWMIFENQFAGRPVENFYRHITIKPDKQGRLIFESKAFRDISDRIYILKRVIYGSDGKLISVLERSYEGGELIYSFTASVQGDELVGQEFDSTLPKTQNIVRISIDRFTSTLQNHLLPIVYAYHIRHDHKAYFFQTSRFSDDHDGSVCITEQEAKESVCLESQEQESHVLQKKTIFKRSGPNPSAYEITDYITVLSSGSIVEIRSESEHIKSRGRRATAAEVKELFDFGPLEGDEY